MKTVLLVVRPFGRHALGDLITDAVSIRAAETGEHAQNVVRIQAPAEATAGREGN
jgi:hypothetical protein